MSGFSKLLLASRTPAMLARSSLLYGANKSSALQSPIKASQQLVQQIRASHGRVMPVRPGKFYTKKYFDMLHFYLFVCGAPFLLAVAYANFFVGPATLTEIPEGYEPRHWEYHRHPLKRFMAKYILESPEQAYENTLSEIYLEQNKIKMRKLTDKVQTLIAERNDSSAWYYVPESTENIEKRKEFLQKHRHGYNPTFTK